MSSDIKLQFVLDGKVYPLDDGGIDRLLKACRVPKSFGGTQYKDPEYGTVEVEVGSKGAFTVMVGNWEWEQAEKKFNVKGVNGVLKAIESEANVTEFYRIALSRNHPKLTARDVSDLRDWRAEGRPTLKDAIERAITFSKPQIFADEEVDPKAVEAVKAGLLLLTSQPESPTNI